MPATHRLDATVVHYEWNNAIPSRLLVEPGDTLVLDTRDAADGYYTAASTSRDTAARGAFKGHPLTGPCLLYTSPSPRDRQKSRMPSSA